MHLKTLRDVEESKVAEFGTSVAAESSANPIEKGNVSFNSTLSLAFFPRFHPIFGI